MAPVPDGTRAIGVSGLTHTGYEKLLAASYAKSADGRKQNHGLHPSMLPIGGVLGAPKTYRTGRIYNIDYANDGRSAGGVSKYAFNFLYNPNAISLSTSVDWGINYSSKDQFATLPNAQQLQFSLMLNRISDVADTGQRHVPNGTLYDLEYLYRTINGDPVYVPGVLSGDPVGYTADLGFLVPTRLSVVFGSRFSFVGYINQLTITHAQFQRDMIPVYTTVDISMSRSLQATGGGTS